MGKRSIGRKRRAFHLLEEEKGTETLMTSVGKKKEDHLAAEKEGWQEKLGIGFGRRTPLLRKRNEGGIPSTRKEKVYTTVSIGAEKNRVGQ